MPLNFSVLLSQKCTFYKWFSEKKISNPCFLKIWKIFTSFHCNGTSYSTVPSFVNILHHSWLKIWGNIKKKVSFFFHFQISSIHASWPSLWTAFTHDFSIWKVSMTLWSDHVKLGRDFIRQDHLLFLNILPCVALKTKAKTAIKHTENLTLIEIYSLLACRMEQNILGKKTRKDESHPR